MDLHFLRPLYAHPGPWASVYVDASRDVPDAAERLATRRRDLRKELADAGAPARALDVLESTWDGTGPVVGDAGLALFANAEGTVGHAVPLPGPPAVDFASWTPLPRVTPLLRAREEEVRWVRAMVDRTGAELSTVDGGRLGVPGTGGYPVHKAKPGGWSQPRYQRAAETNWDRNAGDVAEALTRVADRLSADVIVVAGDVRARELLMARLPGRLAARVVQAPSQDPGALDAATAEAVATLVSDRRAELLDRYRMDLARGRAVQGLAAVCEAARSADLDTVLLAVDGPHPTVWVDPGRPTVLAPDKATVRGLGVAEPAGEPAGDAVLAAATVTDAAAIAVYPDDERPTDGLAAILRYPG